MTEKESVVGAAAGGATSAILPYVAIGGIGYLLYKKISENGVNIGIGGLDNVAGGIIETITNTTEIITEKVTEVKDSATTSPFPETEEPRGGRTTTKTPSTATNSSNFLGYITPELEASAKESTKNTIAPSLSLGGGALSSVWTSNIPKATSPKTTSPKPTSSKTTSSKNITGSPIVRSVTGKDITSERKNLSAKEKAAL